MPPERPSAPSHALQVAGKQQGRHAPHAPLLLPRTVRGSSSSSANTATRASGGAAAPRQLPTLQQQQHAAARLGGMKCGGISRAGWRGANAGRSPKGGCCIMLQLFLGNKEKKRKDCASSDRYRL